MGDADTLVDLAKLAASRHDQRRQYEWKVSFAFWALLVGAVLKRHELVHGLPISIGILVVFLYVFVWLRGVWIANHNDKELCDYFREQAVATLSSQGHRVEADIPPMLSAYSVKYWLGFLRDWAMIFHLLVTIALVAIAYVAC